MTTDLIEFLVRQINRYSDSYCIIYYYSIGQDITPSFNSVPFLTFIICHVLFWLRIYYTFLTKHPKFISYIFLKKTTSTGILLFFFHVFNNQQELPNLIEKSILLPDVGE